MWIENQRTSLGLHNFKKLRHLSWSGLRATRYMGDLRRVLGCNADHMESLKLDIVDWDTANEPPRQGYIVEEGVTGWDDDVEESVVEPTVVANFLAWKVLRLQPNIARVEFPALTSVSLSNISFDGAAAELACAFNGSMLRKLKLQNCRGCAEFLLALIDADKILRLKMFHLSIDDRDTKEAPVNKFLEAFEGLEELGLLIKPGMATPNYWNSVIHHKSTLKRFVYHERRYKYHALSSREDSYEFLDDQPFTQREDRPENYSEASFGELLAWSGLECLALCDDLASLVCNSCSCSY